MKGIVSLVVDEEVAVDPAVANACEVWGCEACMCQQEG